MLHDVCTPVIVLVGPTATGKSRLAVEIALALRAQDRPADIVNADSMLVYRGMDIGTAKPTPQERRGVAHHLIDIADISQRASVAHFQGLARSVIADLRDAGTIPILVGGSALYTRAIVDHFEFPGFDPRARQRWEDELRRIGSRELHRRLAQRAPKSAAKIDPGNGRRIVRALEVLDLTGGHQPTVPEWRYSLQGVHQFGLSLPRDELDARINLRVTQMFDAGFVDEVRALLARGLRETTTAVRAIGYRQVIDLIDGRVTMQEAVASVQRATRAFHRKQLAWYRRDPRITWIDAKAPDPTLHVLRQLNLADTSEKGSRCEG